MSESGSSSQVLHFLHVLFRGYSFISILRTKDWFRKEFHNFIFSISQTLLIPKMHFPPASALPPPRKKSSRRIFNIPTSPLLHLSCGPHTQWPFLPPSQLRTWELGCLGSSILPGDSLRALCLSVKGTTLPEGLNLSEEEQKGTNRRAVSRNLKKGDVYPLYPMADKRGTN